MVDFAPWLHVEYVNGTALIQFPPSDMSEGTALALGGQLSDLAERPGCRRFVLNLGRARCLSSTMFGKLIAFQKKVKQRGGELRLCSLSPDLTARFEAMRLDRLFQICTTEEEAVGRVPAGVV